MLEFLNVQQSNNNYDTSIMESELHLAQGSHNLKFCVGIFDNNQTPIASSDYVNFTITK